MLKRKILKWLPTLLPILTLIIGIVINRLININLPFNTFQETVINVLGVLCFFAAVHFVFIALYASEAKKREETWIQNFGRPAEMIYEPPNDRTGEYIHKIMEFIRQVSDGDEILIMTQHRIPLSPADHNKASQDAREAYSKLLLQKVKEKNISYHRIFCFENVADTTEINNIEINNKTLRQWHVDHCRELLQIKKEKDNTGNISLKKSRIKIGAGIFIIRGKVGSILIDVYDTNSGKTATNSSLFFYSPPNAQIIEQMYKWFTEVEKDADTKPVKEVA